jgi:hypothetical protein
MLFSNLLNQLLLKANCLKINSIKKASTFVKAFDTCELGGSIFYDPQKVVLHKYQSPVSQALFLCLFKIPSRSSTLGQFFRHKKSLHNCEGFDTCELGGSRTPNLLIRSQVLYPIKLRVHAFYLKDCKSR